MRIAGIVQDSIVDGPGLRFTVFVQGCHHRCPGCQNPHTHDPAGGWDCTLEELICRLRSNPLTDGLSLSGGEPFDQPVECLALAQAAHRMGMDVWCWTGGIYEDLRDHGTAAQRSFLADIDVLVDGPFLIAQRTLSLPWRGSRNQRIILVPDSLRAGRTIVKEEPAQR